MEGPCISGGMCSGGWVCRLTVALVCLDDIPLGALRNDSMTLLQQVTSDDVNYT